jgi:hypothetical protein
MGAGNASRVPSRRIGLGMVRRVSEYASTPTADSTFGVNQAFVRRLTRIAGEMVPPERLELQPPIMAIANSSPIPGLSRRIKNLTIFGAH